MTFRVYRAHVESPRLSRGLTLGRTKSDVSCAAHPLNEVRQSFRDVHLRRVSKQLARLVDICERHQRFRRRGWCIDNLRFSLQQLFERAYEVDVLDRATATEVHHLVSHRLIKRSHE